MNKISPRVLLRLVLPGLFLAFLPLASYAQIMYGLSGTSLLRFSANDPTTIENTVTVSGISAGQTLAGLDFRPNTGQLYTIGYNNATGEARLYTLNLNTGAATAVGAAAVTLVPGMGQIGFDFNPTVDRIRVTGSNGANYRLHPVTGAIASTDTNLAFAGTDLNAGATAAVGAVAYTNSYAGSGATTLYNYDYNLNVLTTQNPPNNGTLNTVGTLGPVFGSPAVSSDMDIYFDPAAKINRAFFIGNDGSSTTTTLYRLDLMTGAVTAIGPIDGGQPVSYIAALSGGVSGSPLIGKLVYALTVNNNLVTFDSGNPGQLRSIAAVSGVAMGQVLAGIDFRPATGELYGLGYNASTGEAQLYVINRATAVATPVGAGPVNLGANLGRVGFDFNPTVDRIRVTGSNNANFRLHPVTGAIAATDSNLAFAAGDPNQGVDPNIGAVAYTNSFFGTATTTLYNYDDSLNIFTTQIPPNNGTLNTVGSSGIIVNPADRSVDFDITYDSTTQTNQAFMAANTGTQINDDFYTVNLSTGAVTLAGSVGLGVPIKSIAVVINRSVPAQVTGRLIYALTGNNNLVSFDSDNPGILRTLVAISGIAMGQTLAGIDFRPATGELYGLGYNATSGEAQVYKIDAMTGTASAVGAAINLGANLGAIGFDFNPVVDRIRVTSSSGANFRLHPDTGALAATDSNLAFAAGDVNQGASASIGASAYTNSFNGTTTTTLYNISQSLSILTTQNPPNNGTLNTVGPLGISLDTTDRTVDLDIFYNPNGQTNTAYLAANVLGSNKDGLYTVNLSSGAVTALGTIGLGVPVRSIAVALVASAPAGVDLELTASANPGTFAQYEDVTYTLTLTNKGSSAAHNVSVAAGLVNGLVFTSSAASQGTYNLFFERWDVGTLEAGQSATLTLKLFPLVKDPSIVNFFQVMTQDEADLDSTPGNDTDNTPNEDDEVSVTITGPAQPPSGGVTADLSLTASVETNSYSIYEDVTYRLMLVNSGPDAASGISVSAGLPQGFVYTSDATMGGAYNLFFQRWDVGYLEAGDTAWLDLVLFPLISDTDVSNFFEVMTSDQDDPDSTPGNGAVAEDDAATVVIVSNFNSDDPQDRNGQDKTFGDLKLYPVPATANITLQMNSFQAMETAVIYLFDQSGRVVQTQSTTVAEGFNSWTFDISGLPAGMYFLRLPGQHETLKFIKE